MHICELSPFVRFAGRLEYRSARRASMTYDCRMLYILSGEGSVTVEREMYALEAGAFFFIPPAAEYRFTARPSFSAIAVDFDMTEEYAHETASYPPLPPASFDMERMHAIPFLEDGEVLASPLVLRGFFEIEPFLRSIVEEISVQDSYARERASLYLKLGLFEILRRCERGRHRSIADRVVAYLHEHYAEEVTNEELGRIFRHAPCYLSRAVKARFGVSLHRYLMRLRMDAGTRLLLSSDLSVSEIAERCGFYSGAHFSAAYKKMTGLSPTEYRRSL